MNQSNIAPRSSRGHKRSRLVENWLLQKIFRAIGPAPIQFVLKDGEVVGPSHISPLATVIIYDRRTLAELILDPAVAFGEAYAAGRLEVVGDLTRALEMVYRYWPDGNAAHSWYAQLASAVMNWRQSNSLGGARDNIHRHYDLGNDFYKLWLDSDMLYTCAYFESPGATLEHAQQAKMDYICRKLGLHPGERVVEAGCGWGSLALFMARNYGVHVKAFNISREQIRYAREQATEAGLSGRVEFIEDDYRNIRGWNDSQRADALVSVGMLEHVGVANYAELGEAIYHCVGDSGRGLLHFIGRSYPEDFNRWIRMRIFRGAYAPTLQEAMRVLEPRHYSVLDVENLRSHYAQTLEHWLDRYEKSGTQVYERYGAWFQRAWRLYLAGSIAAFRTGSLQLFQVVFAGSQCEPRYWTRAPLYTKVRSLEAHGECAEQWIPATS